MLVGLKLTWVSFVVARVSLFNLVVSVRLLGLVLCSMCRRTALRWLGLWLGLDLEYFDFRVFALFTVSSLCVNNQVVPTPASRGHVLLTTIVSLFINRSLFRR